MPVQVTDFISTTAPSDTYATHDSSLGKGGFREVADTAARDAIPLARRTVGMVVITADTGRLWKLTNAGTNTYVEVLLLEGTITSPTDGQVLEYDTGTGKWINATPTGGGGGASTLGDLTDVDLVTTPPVAGDLLLFDGTTWVPGIIDGGDGGYDNNSPNFQLSLVNTSPDFQL
jgi:hypothetical protein